MKKIFVFLCIMFCLSTSFAQTCNTTVPTYTTINNACNSGNLSTSSEWVSGLNPSFVLSNGAYTIPAGIVIDITSSNFALDYDLIIYGTLLVEGKLVMTNSTNKIIVMSGGLVTCCASGYCGSSCPSCDGSDKVSIGGVNVYCGIGCGTVNGSFVGVTVLSNTGLPITLASFNGDVNGDRIDLNWSTVSELNFDYFLLQRSVDGKNFITIDQIKGNGTTNIKHEYNTSDETPLSGINYYRLISVDFDNTTETFHVINVKYSGNRNITLSPNPTTGSEVTINTNFEFNGTISVFDNLGFLILKSDITSTVTKFNFTSELKSGLYIVKFDSNDFSKSIRLIIK